MDRTSNEVVVRDANGKVCRRNINHVKKIPEELHELQTEKEDTNESYSVPETSSYVENDRQRDPENSNLILKLKNIEGMWRPVH